MNIPKSSRSRHLDVSRSLLAGHSLGAVSRRFNITSTRCFDMLKAVSIEALSHANKAPWKIAEATRLSQILKDSDQLRSNIDNLELFWSTHV